MLYGNIRDEEGAKHLEFTCKNCGYIERESNPSSLTIVVRRYDEDSKISPQDEKCVSQTNYFDDIRSFQQYQTINIKHDLTLPRVKNIDCPKCNGDIQNSGGDKKKNKEKETLVPEVICVKYDQANMKYLYFCCHCDHFWKLET